jgi:uncharacterized protein (TIGR02246 family)
MHPTLLLTSLRSAVRPMFAGLAVLALGFTTGCSDSPVAQAAPGDGLQPSSASFSALPAPPPAAVRGIDDLLARWTASWNAMDGQAYGSHYAEDADFVNPLGGVVTGSAAIGATHVFLFSTNGPFRGSRSSYQVRRMVALTGNLAIVDLNVSLSGYAFLPPGLSASPDGVVRTRGRLIVGTVHGEWKILAQQYTSLNAPGF